MQQPVIPNESSKALEKLSKISAPLAIVSKAIVILTILLVFGIALLAFLGKNDLLQVYFQEEPSWSFFATGLVVTLTFWTLSHIFSDIAKGLTPFSRKQVNRIRLASILIFASALSETFLSPSFLALIFNSNLEIGFVVESFGPIPISVSSILLSVIFFCISLAFQYGTELQELSNDTV